MSSFFADLKLTLDKAEKFFHANYKNPINILAKAISFYPINRLIPDRLYLSIRYRAYTGFRLNLSNPKRFNDKTQWLKLYDKKDWYSKIADKVEVQKYVSSRVGDQYLIPIIGVYNSVDEMDFEKLPNQFVLKCTHDSGTVVICSDKSKFNIEGSKKILSDRMKRNYYYIHREYCYKSIKPRIICEEFISPDGKSIPTDFKFFCFHGVPKLIQVDEDRFGDHGRLTMHANWTKAPFDINPKYVKSELTIERPNNLEEMLEISKKLSKDFKFVRVDLYSVNNKVYFGELTLYQGAGYNPIYPDEYNFWLGDLLDINK